MGSTGHSIFSHSRQGNVNTTTFGITNAVNYKGRVPANSGLSPVGANRITLKLPTSDKDNILFQFRLTKDSKFMIISAYKSGRPEIKCKVDVDSHYPSLDSLMSDGNSSDIKNAIKMKNLMSQSSEIKENQLGAIAHKLLAHKQGGR